MSETFRAVHWMRERRARIDEEDEGLSWEEKSRRTREVVERDPLWLHLKDRVLSSSKVPPSREREEGS